MQARPTIRLAVFHLVRPTDIESAQRIRSSSEVPRDASGRLGSSERLVADSRPLEEEDSELAQCRARVLARRRDPRDRRGSGGPGGHDGEGARGRGRVRRRGRGPHAPVRGPRLGAELDARAFGVRRDQDRGLLISHQTDDYGGGNRDQHLAKELGDLERSAEGLERYQRGIAAKPRKPPAIDDAESYATERLKPQIVWYRDKADGLEPRAGLFTWLQFGLGILGAALAAVAGATEAEKVAVWVPGVTTVGASLGRPCGGRAL
jgi:hypothetical protein